MEKKIKVKTLWESLKESMDILDQELFGIENLGIFFDKKNAIELINKITVFIKHSLELEKEAKKALKLKEEEVIGGNKYRESIRKIIKHNVNIRDHAYNIMADQVDRQIQITKHEIIDWNK